MPKQVDHEERRQLISDALLRLTAREGLEAVSLRQVAAEAKLSMGAVQHYFRTKDEMLKYALDYQTERRTARITERVLSGAVSPTPRGILRTCMVELLPVDEDKRTDYLVGVAFFIRALSDREIAQVVIEGEPKVTAFFAGLIRQAQEAGDAPPELSPEEEAEVVWALIDSQRTSVVLGQRTPAEAEATFDYYLDRIFR